MCLCRDWNSIEKELDEFVKIFVEEFFEPTKHGLAARANWRLRTGNAKRNFNFFSWFHYFDLIHFKATTFVMTYKWNKNPFFDENDTSVFP